MLLICDLLSTWSRRNALLLQLTAETVMDALQDLEHCRLTLVLISDNVIS